MIACPHCGSTEKHHPRGSASRPNRYRCATCRRHFTDRGEGPHLLSIDVETLPPVFYAWSPWNQNLGRNMMIKDWSLLSYSAKWVGDERIISSVLTPEEALSRNDKRISQEIWNLLDKAHVVITHNGRRFDIKKINTRFWKHKLHKPNSYKVIDTLAAAKSVFGLTYNSMDFIAEFVERDQKLETSKGLWTRADRGDPKALQEMQEYNDQDIRTQEQIYMEMREWIPGHPNLPLYVGQENGCPVCMSKQYTDIGFYYAKKKKYLEYRCDRCQATWHNTKAFKKKG